MATVTQQYRQVAVSSPFGDDTLLFRRMTLQEGLSQPFQYDLQLLSLQDLNLADLVGQNMTVRLEQPAGGTRYFNGFVSQCACLGRRDEFLIYQVTLRPWLWLLTRTSDCRIYQEMTLPEIIKDVFSENGFTDLEDRLMDSYPTWEYCVQYQETCFNFVSRLMEQAGIYYYFRHENGHHHLVLCDSYSAHEPVEHYQEIAYHDQEWHQRRGEEHIHNWRVQQQLLPVKYALNDFDFTAPRKDLQVISSIPRQHSLAEFELYDYPGEYQQFGDGEQYARVRIEEQQSRYELAHGQSDARGLVPGCLFNLINHPHRTDNREYLVIETRAEIESDDYRSGGGGGTNYSCSFTALRSDTPFRPQRVTPKPVVQGPQTAIVVGKSGEEIWTDEHGRVKVKFHWDRYGKADETGSCWIRVAQTWAGKRWGTIQIPRIGQEVIVDFLEGDPDRPLITGRLYNGDNRTPYKLPDYAYYSTWKSDTTKDGSGFNEIRLDDQKGSEQIFIHSQGRMDQRVRGSLYETNYGNREVRVGWEKDGDKGGDYNTLIRNDVNTHIQEGEYRLVDKSLHQTVTEDVLEKHDKNHTLRVEKDFSISATKVIVEGGSQVSHKSGKITIEGTQKIHIKGGQINLEGQMGISLKVGGNFVVLDPSGVSINGMMVKINSGGSAQAAEAALSFSEATLEEPLEALAADDGQPGKKSGAGGSPRSRKKVTLKPHEVPPYQPPPPVKEPPPGDKPPPPIKEPPPVPVSDKPCGVAALEVTCGHGRKPQGGQLHVVAGPATDFTYSETWGGKVSVSVRKKYGGQESLKATVKPVDPKAGGGLRGCLMKGMANPSDADWQGGGQHSFSTAPVDNDDLWPLKATPEVWSVCGRGCDEVYQRITVKAYPNQVHAVSISLALFEEFAKGINETLERYSRTIFGFVEIKPEFEGPKGEIKAEWGWKENDDWRAVYEVSAAIAVNPICGIKITFTLSAATLAGAAVGIPPVFSKFAGNHLADILLGVGFGVAGTFEGGPKGSFYSDGEERYSGEAALGVEGSAELSLTGRVGSDYILSGKLKGAGTTKIAGAAKATLKREGLFLSPEVKLNPLTTEVSITFMAFTKEVKSHKAQWQVFSEKVLYPTAGNPVQWKLFPR